MTLLYTMTIQKVAWPMMIVQIERSIPQKTN